MMLLYKRLRSNPDFEFQLQLYNIILRFFPLRGEYHPPFSEDPRSRGGGSEMPRLGPRASLAGWPLSLSLRPFLRPVAVWIPKLWPA